MGIETALIIGGLTAAGGAIGGSAIASSAAGKAAETQAGAATDAAKAQLEAAKYYADMLSQTSQGANRLQELQYLLGYQGYQPYQQVGTEALYTLKDLLQPSGYLAQAAPQFQFDVQKVAEDPGYQFAMQEGTKALERSAAAKGTLLSGATAKALERYGTDYATTKTGEVYNRNLSQYQTNFDVEQANRQNLYNRLAAMAGIGQQASGGLMSAGANMAGNIGSNQLSTAGNIANIGMSGAQNASDYLTSAAAARASGYASGGSIWGQAFGQLGQLPMQYLTLSKLLGK